MASPKDRADRLRRSSCRPVPAKQDPMPDAEAAELLAALPDWAAADGGRAIRREYLMRDFAAAAELVARIAEVADAQDHHPDLHLTGYRRLAVELSTHSIGGLSENDFILAAKIEDLPKSLKPA